MRDTDFIIEQGWMMTRLHLEGAARAIYALIYGYSKDGCTWYETNKSNICEWLGVTERTVQAHLSKLISAGYIIRKEEKYGRGSKMSLMVNHDIIERAEKGEEFSPLKREKLTTEKGEKISKKGEIFSEIPYIKILLKDNISISLLRAPAREEEEKEFFKIFYFLGSADPSADTVEFIKWNRAFNKEWDNQTIQQKYYFASAKWQVSVFRSLQPGWMPAWSQIYNWAVEHDAEFAPQLLDVRFRGTGYVDGGEKLYEIRVSSVVREWLRGHKDEVLEPFIRPLCRDVKRIEWKLI